MRGKTAGILIAAAGLALAACGNHSTRSQEAHAPAAASAGASANAPRRVDIVAQGMRFQQAPDTIPAGWTTFRFRNESSLTHFVAVERLPDGVDVKQYEVAGRVYQRSMDLISAGKTDAGMKELGNLPEWTAHLVTVGGPGLTAPGRTSRATTFLAPGHYMIECYVKTDGVFHSYSSPSHPPMIHPLTVTAATAPTAPPGADVRVVVSSEKGLSLRGRPTAGTRTFAVYFEKQDRNAVGPDVHLFRIEKDGDVDAAAAWMNALAPNGLQTPAPVAFLGGTEERQTGETAYFTATLKPGRYGLVSEVADPAAENLLATFTVPEEEPTGG